MKLSVLDQGPVTKGNKAVEALKKAEELALLVDSLGYTRMWMAEHHGTPAFASSAPEITTAHLAAKTTNLRVGTGGIMMMHYSPLKMAEVFKTLSALSPNRIDFGVGRAPGGDSYSVYGLSEGREPNVYNLYEKLQLTLELLNDEIADHPIYERTIAMPNKINLPEAWLLGSSGSSARQAGQLGVGYSFAQFFNGDLSREIIELYKRSFTPSPFMEKPKTIVTYMVTVAETKEEAEFEGRPQDIVRMMLRRGQGMQRALTPEEAKDYPLTEKDLMEIKDNRRLHLVGSVKEIAERLQQEKEYYGFDEAMICSIPHSQEKRLDVYRLLAKELLS